MVWILKGRFFPDKSFEDPTTLGSNFIVFLFLCFYYLIPFSTISTSPLEIENGRVLVSSFIYILGVFYMCGADSQKYFTLKYKKGLIS